MKVAFLPSGQERIEKAFQTASTSTGASFDYLVKTAVRESNMNPSAKAATSTAAGTFQFIEGTWLETVKQSGGRFGLDKYADQIERTAKGSYVVRDSSARREILDLRHDPEISALMAGALTQKNSKNLENFLGRPPSDGELYIAHFLGATGAKRLIGLSQTKPETNAAAYFKTQARANKPIFFDSAGKPRSAQAVYQNLVNRHDGTQLIGTALASVEPRPKPLLQTGAATLAATPLAKPTVIPATSPADSPVGAANVTVDRTVIDRLDSAWNVVAAADDPAELSTALKVAAAPLSQKSNRFDQTFEIANAATRPVNLAFAANGSNRVLTGNFRTVTTEKADRLTSVQPAGAQSAELQPVKTSSLANAPAAIDASANLPSGSAGLPNKPVAAPFHVKEPKTAFESLYRTDSLAPRTRVGETFAMAYSAQTSLFSSPEGEAINLLFGQSSIAGRPGGSGGSFDRNDGGGRQPGKPLDLGEYLRLRPQGAQRELLPPV